MERKSRTTPKYTKIFSLATYVTRSFGVIKKKTFYSKPIFFYVISLHLYDSDDSPAILYFQAHYLKHSSSRCPWKINFTSPDTSVF